MEPGANGQPGAAAPRRAEKGENPGLETATNLQPSMEETSVLVTQLRRRTALNVSHLGTLIGNYI